MKIKILIGLILVFCVPVLFESIRDEFHSKEITPIADTICVEDSFSVRDFVLELHLQEIKYPDVVLRQACWETGFFTSGIWKKKHNPFGLFYNGEYILFNDWRSAVSYYKEWQDKRYKGGDYYDFLIKVGYAQDSNYVNSVRHIDLINLKKSTTKY
jgi:hypothetical protein